MIERRELTVREGGVRLDAALLSAFPGTTRALVRDAIAGGMVTVNGHAAVKGRKLRAGDKLGVVKLAEAADNLVAPDPAIAVSPVYADDAIIAFDKPAGMSVQPLSRTERGTLMNAVVAAYPECQALGDRPLMAGALHRIDAGTSGLVLVARTAAAFDALRSQFAAQTVRKTYLALVEGSVEGSGTVQNELVHDPHLPYCRMIDRRRARVAEAERERLRVLPARTDFRPLAAVRRENEVLTLLAVTIYTGVTHQIRAHLSSIGHPIVNDRLYGAFAVENQIGHCLHAFAAAFNHPITGESLEIRTPPPRWEGCDFTALQL